MAKIESRTPSPAAYARSAPASLAEAGRRREPRAPNQEGRVLPWEEIEAGRYMPRRTRGSYPGRELG
jgi:hypothetical protein